MIQIRRSKDRGGFDFGWLDTKHTFSFGDYYDPQHVRFRSLRVLNEDLIHPKGEFPNHPHRDMEIITYVVSGALEHGDSMGNGSVIRPGDVQRMSAGTGVIHREANPSQNEIAHILQIWIMPREKGLAPGYEQKTFSDDDKRGRLRLVASPDGREGSVAINQDALVFASLLTAGEKVKYAPTAARHVWIQLIRGELDVLGESLHTGDGAAISDEATLEIQSRSDAEFLLFDLS